MPITALRPNVVRRYVPKACQQDPVETRTVFLLRTLSAELVARVLDAHAEQIQTDDQGKVVSVMAPRDQRNLEMLRLCVAGWENFVDVDGVPAEFTSEEATVYGQKRVERATVDAVSMIPPTVRKELADVCWGATEVTEDDAKN